MNHWLEQSGVKPRVHWSGNRVIVFKFKDLK